MTLNELNQLSATEAATYLEQCCAAPHWVDAMVALRPFTNAQALHTAAQQCFAELDDNDWLQAFAAHPMIGDLTSLQQKYANTSNRAASEQSGTRHASTTVLQQLLEANRQYRDKFGFIFIVFASGKNAAQMLELLQQRLANDRSTELVNAATEQQKITALRLEEYQ